MENIDEKIKAAQMETNQCRMLKDKPQATEFMTVQFKHGFVTMPIEEFNKLPKAKAKRLMRD